MSSNQQKKADKTLTGESGIGDSAVAEGKMTAKELALPPDAVTDADSREMLRAWIAHEGLHCTLNIGGWGEREVTGWGVLLSDVARHVAQALHKDIGADPNEVLAEIREVFNSELDEPTAETSGGFVNIQ